ncbi:MAG: cupin domain-containing protein, partial [Alphaproteobacteria bacterium]|nr:cupin domain-containing protein [Alphaproteobacteria bacterium]
MIETPPESRIVGGVGLTHVHVYDMRPGPDGRMSGCAHVHAITDEGYFVLAGTGSLELHDADNGFRVIPLEKGRYVQFSAGTVHRTVSNGGLEILVVIGNGGLAEHGDARIYFGPAADEDSREYDRLSALSDQGGLESALRRRDASVDA